MSSEEDFKKVFDSNGRAALLRNWVLGQFKNEFELLSDTEREQTIKLLELSTEDLYGRIGDVYNNFNVSAIDLDRAWGRGLEIPINSWERCRLELQLEYTVIGWALDNIPDDSEMLEDSINERE